MESHGKLEVKMGTLFSMLGLTRVRSQRRASCDDVFKRQPNETSEQKKDRQRRHMLCRYASLGHPNRKGALLYADAITEALKATLGTKGLSRIGER